MPRVNLIVRDMHNLDELYELEELDTAADVGEDERDNWRNDRTSLAQERRRHERKRGKEIARAIKRNNRLPR
ncbi:MAG: hypothetical protein MUD01_03670 [Chloroflexaceae bacterium]|jgi:hypothetical protein|nr:hypothetical protein [Chloroflexaceae bacterium]